MTNRSLGSKGEETAVRYLEKKGFKILKQNYTASSGEVDIIGVKDFYLVFFEVKSWKRYGYADMGRAVGKQKQKRIIRTAEIFMHLEGEYGSFQPRFDIIFIDLKTGELKHIEDAFNGEHVLW